jgi:hypothetical protein
MHACMFVYTCVYRVLMQGIDHLEALPVGENKGHRRREVEGDSRRQRDKEINRVQCLCECL